MNLLELLRPADDARGARIHGVVVGIVTNNQDPDGLGRVRLKFPWLLVTRPTTTPWMRALPALSPGQIGRASCRERV